MTWSHEEVSTQQIRKKFIAHEPLHINSWGKENIEVYSKLVITLQVGSHTPPSTISISNL